MKVSSSKLSHIPYAPGDISATNTSALQNFILYGASDDYKIEAFVLTGCAYSDRYTSTSGNPTNAMYLSKAMMDRSSAYIASGCKSGQGSPVPHTTGDDSGLAMMTIVYKSMVIGSIPASPPILLAITLNYARRIIEKVPPQVH